MKTKIAYLLGTYPTVTETFVYREIEGVSKHIPLVIFALERGAATNAVQDAPVYYAPTLRSFGFWGNLFNEVFRRPGLLLGALKDALLHGDSDRLKAFVRGANFVRMIRRQGITHIHAHFATAPTRVARMLAAMTDISFSFSAHAQDIYTVNPGLAGHISHAAFVVTCTDYNRKYLQSVVPACGSKIHLVYHGIPLESWPFAEAGPALHDPVRILTVGRLVEKKGYNYLLEAVAALAVQGLRISWTVVGDGVLYAELVRQAHRLGLCVEFVGWQSQESVRALMYDSDLFVQPSVHASDGDVDGIPNVIPEAMACGLPVVATAVSGIPEILNADNGILVPEKSPQALAEAIHTLVRDERLRERLRRKARQRVEGFSTCQAVEALEALFCNGRKNDNDAGEGK